MNYKELTKKLRALGCHEIPRRGGGSHRKWVNPALEKVPLSRTGGIGILNKGRLEEY